MCNVQGVSMDGSPSDTASSISSAGDTTPTLKQTHAHQPSIPAIANQHQHQPHPPTASYAFYSPGFGCTFSLHYIILYA